MWSGVLSTIRDLGRVHEIARVLIWWGFGDVVRRVGLAAALESAGRALRVERAAELARLDPPARLRRVLEELGPTFVKLGQLCATRIDLFPPEWINEFETLQDRVTPVPFSELQAQLEEDLGAPLDRVLAEVDPEPIGAGSLAQVYRARTHEGDAVILKVRRPNIRSRVSSDLRLLGRLATLLEDEFEELRRFRPVALHAQLERSLQRELDFEQEAHNAERVARAFESNPFLVVPAVRWEWTTERLNVQEWIDGIPGRDVARAASAGYDLDEIARRGAEVVLKMVLEHGFFHADPHPGNVFLLPGSRIALIDYGMVGSLSNKRREELIEFLHALVERDARTAADIVADWVVADPADPDALAADIDALLVTYHGLSLEQLDVQRLLGDFTRLLRDHGLALPADLVMFFKVILTLDGFGRLLNPEFEIVTELRPLVREMLRERYKPRRLLAELRRISFRTMRVLGRMPGDLNALLRAGRRGQLQLRVELARVERITGTVERAANRLTVGIVAAALIIGTAIVMTVDAGPRLFGWPALGLIGFVSSFLLGVWLLRAILRSGRQ